jgi:LysR family transcriptional regulator, hydrogen peroxide-inducible genes activator
MEIHQLRYFRAVAKYGTFTKAAEVEHVAQPSLSHQILKLEAELGSRLFDRLPRSARLTAFGKAFLVRAERILNELGDAKLEMLHMAGVAQGEVTLGIIPTVSAYLLPKVIGEFLQENPQISLNVVEEITPILLARLRESTIDLAVMALPLTGSEMLCTTLFEESFFAVLPADHRLAQNKKLELSELRREPFLVLKEGHCFRDGLIAACRESKVRPNIAFESGQFSTILAMVSAGAGVSAVPATAVQQVPGCAFVPIAGKRAKRRIGIVRLKRHFESRAQQMLCAHMVAACGQARVAA